MPIPSPKDNEKQDEKYPQKQKVAICLNTYSNPKKKSKANEMEIDFSEDIKKMNKQKKIKIEEAPKTEVKVEKADNKEVATPSPEVKLS